MVNPSNHLSITTAAVVVSLAVCGCADEVQPPAKSPTQQDVNEKPDDDGFSGSIVVDPEIAALCELPTSHFAFDRAKLSAGASEALDALVTCLSSGGLKGRALSLVGHADPRGELQYNFALGQRRAGNVEGYLSEHGIDGSRMTTSSRGELDATGVDKASWADDRKVVIRLADNEAN